MSTPDDSQNDSFRPPQTPVEVRCLHCGQEYESYLIHWEEHETEDGKRGFWCCPTPGCGGMGFGFDIFPTDPEYRDEEGNLMWHDDDEEDDDEGEDLDDAGDSRSEPRP